jgi:hypothetical protein
MLEDEIEKNKKKQTDENDFVVLEIPTKSRMQRGFCGNFIATFVDNLL